MNKSGVGEQIRSLREQKKMTQKQLGELLGYSESYISYVEKNERVFNTNDLMKLATVFNVEPNFFLPMQGIKTHFRADNKGADVDYDKMLDDFDSFVESKSQI